MNRKTNKNFRRGFTLMEMLVTIALVVMIITGVGLLTKHMGELVSTSQASNELLSNVRAAQSLIENDLNNLDRNGFLVIRGRKDGNGRRFDMMSFLAVGAYPNRTGTDNTSAGFALFNDFTTANGALVWYGHCTLERPGGSGTFMAPNLSFHAPLSQAPSGSKDEEFVLGRRAMSLMAASGITAERITVFPQGAPAAGVKIPAFVSPKYDAPAVTASNLETFIGAADITSSRVSVAAQTNQQVMFDVMTQTAGRSGASRYEADNYCYRLHILESIYGNNDTNFPLNYFRMHPQLLQSCPSFSVEWTDGSAYALPGDPRDKQVKWYGVDNPKGDSAVETSGSNGDNYCAVFSYDNKASWPKAIRITMRVLDRNQRLNSAREFSLVVRISR